MLLIIAGYLMYGPPGCGKTSFVTCLAGALHLNICCLVLSSNNLNDEDLNERLRCSLFSHLELSFPTTPFFTVQFEVF